MVNTQPKRWVLLLVAATTMWVSDVRADSSGVNDFVVKSELYIWNRLADFLEIVRCGIAVGPSIGAEVAITDKAMLGAYVSREVGTSFPHFIPPLWLVPYLEDQPVLKKHRGIYKTVAFGDVRKESDMDPDVRFDRDPLDVRAQVAAGLVQVYAAVKTAEVGDFLVGWVGLDPKNDDEKLDPTARREPANQFGRSLSNILFGWIELGKNMIRVNEEEGNIAGATKGLGLGLWRTTVREVVGVMELVTFPFGWDPIIQPVYVLQPAYTTEWRINPPTFGNRY